MHTTDTKTVSVMLRLEGLIVLIVAVSLYATLGYSWLAFALLFFAPDLALIPYAIDQRVGIGVYNVLHTYTLPLMLGLVGFVAGWPIGLQLALIWLAHIGMDRLVGYGLKYRGALKETHLGRV